MLAEPSDSLRELATCAELFRLDVTEMTAMQNEGGDAGELQEPSFDLELGPSNDGSRFRVLLGVRLAVESGRARIRVRTEYERGNYQGELTPDLLLEFANHVAVMTALPHVRSALADVTLRVLGSPVLMPVFQRGDLWFDAPGGS